MMELALYFSDVNYVENIEDVLHPVDYHNIPVPIMDILFGDVNFIEYYNHLIVLEHLQTYLSEGMEFSRLYFGQEFCEYLIPTLDELKKAYYFSMQLGWNFTYVTGYLTDKGIEKTKENLEFLARENRGIEVVVNDWGMLSIVNREFPQLQPVLGRMLIKQKRLARFANGRPPINMRGIDVSVDEIAQNQKEALKDLNLSIGSYRKELKSLGIRRVELDIVPQGVNLNPRAWGFSFSCYYPWTYLTCGRNCSTAAVNDPVREYVVVDEPCSKPCRTLNRSADIKESPVPIVQRGNTVFAFTHSYANPYLRGGISIDRLIFEPYIPL